MAAKCGSNKMCSLNCCGCKVDVKMLRPLVNAPKYICKSCGRVANKKANLCNPVAL